MCLPPSSAALAHCWSWLWASSCSAISSGTDPPVKVPNRSRHKKRRTNAVNQSFNIIVNIITLGFGVYAIFTWFKLRDGLLFDNSLLIPKERTIAECRDAAGYIAYIRPRTLVAGIFTFLSGALGLVDSYLGTIQNWAVANG